MKYDTLSKNILRFIEPLGIKKVKFGNTFNYNSLTKEVEYTIFSFESDKYLIDYVNNTYEIDITPWYFIFSLLHEVGHHNTLSKLTEEDYKYEFVMRNFLRSRYCYLAPEEINNWYFNLPAEKMATEWAIDYIDNNLKKCWDFQRKCFGLMKHWYKKKGLAC